MPTGRHSPSSDNTHCLSVLHGLANSGYFAIYTCSQRALGVYSDICWNSKPQWSFFQLTNKKTTYYLKLKLFTIPPTKLFDLDTSQRQPRKGTVHTHTHIHKMGNVCSIFSELTLPGQEGVGKFLFIVLTNSKINFPLTQMHKCETEIERPRFEGMPNYLPAWVPKQLGPALILVDLLRKALFYWRFYSKLGNKAKGYQHVLWGSHRSVLSRPGQDYLIR